MAVLRSSHRRYSEYRAKLKERRRNKEADDGGSFHSSGPERKKPHKRSRSFFKLFVLFWGLLAEHRRMLVVALATLGVSTLLGLIPLYGTKIVFDSVLRENPLPVRLPYGMHLPFSNLFEISHNGPFDVAHDRRALLTFVAVAMVLLTAAAELFGLWSRWQATRMTKRVQVSVRKRVFDHAVRLPLHRVYELKSGGVASILREDAGGVADLIFSMLYNPWRAIVQLVGSLIILAWADWRLLTGALVLVPLVFLTHRTWINRIRPQHKAIRARRESIDAHTTESFSGMRVVRGFSREHSEAGRFVRSNDLMARQELLVWWWARIIEICWEALIPLSSGLLMLYGGWQVLQGTLTLGDLMMFLVYLAMLLEPLAVLAESAAGGSLRPTTRPAPRNTNTGIPIVPKAPSGSRRNILISIHVNLKSPRSIVIKPYQDQA